MILMMKAATANLAVDTESTRKRRGGNIDIVGVMTIVPIPPIAMIVMMLDSESTNENIRSRKSLRRNQKLRAVMGRKVMVVTIDCLSSLIKESLTAIN